MNSKMFLHNVNGVQIGTKTIDSTEYLDIIVIGNDGAEFELTVVGTVDIKVAENTQILFSKYLETMEEK